MKCCEKLYLGNLSRELYNFVVNVGSLHWRKLKFDRTPPSPTDEDGPQSLKLQFKVDNNQRWLV